MRKLYGDIVIPEFTLLKGDCLKTLKQIADCSIDSVICDPPYHLQSITKRFGGDNSAEAKYGTDGLFQRSSKGFMNKTWDGGDIAFRTDVWKECFRVLKPGGHLLAFGGTRTMHRITCAIEDSGFEIRDLLCWIQYQGFPKSRNISLDMDKMVGLEKTLTGGYCIGNVDKKDRPHLNNAGSQEYNYNPKSQQAQKWDGFGTALKPSHEPATIARKPIEQGLSIAKNVLKWGTGAMNIDACRLQPGDPAWPGPQEEYNINKLEKCSNFGQLKKPDYEKIIHDQGRWPANIYQCPKPSRKEKEAGLSHLDPITGAEAVNREPDSAGINNPRAGAGRTSEEVRNTHPTIKPRGVMEWAIRLLTPPGGVVLDPFAGSGTTGVSSIVQGFDCILCELTPEYWPIIEGRVADGYREWKDANRQYKLFG